MSAARFDVGDLVSRDGTDVHRVREIDYGFGIMTVECVKEPLGYEIDDGVRGEPWIKLGETEDNLISRYHFIGR